MDTPAINVLSLFSGIGGLDLGVKLVLPNTRTVCYVEREFAVCEIMGARFADGSLDDAPIFTDIAAFDGKLWRGVVDLIIGGFPCQDLSVAGKRRGITGERSGLWFEYARIIREVEPRWVMVENVPPVLAFPAGHAVLRELAESGFDAEWISLRASDVGAPHRRERVFILAHRRMADGKGGGLGMLRESSIGFGGGGDSLTGATHNWSTPSTEDHKSDGPYVLGRFGTEEMKTSDQRLRNQAMTWPTPDAHAVNDGESAESWRKRQERLKQTANNGNGAGVPLAIAALEMGADE